MLRAFETTSWSMILAAKDEDSQARCDALNRLCQTYWPPIYSYFRSRNYSEEDAQDLTQEFFFHLLKRQSLSHVGQERGKFRTFLLTAAENLLKDENRRLHAQKRNPPSPVLPLDEALAESLYTWSSSANEDPRALFDRQWAQTLLDNVLRQLEDEFSASGRSQVFEVLKDNLVMGKSETPYRVLSERLGMSEGAARNTVYRMRQRYAVLLREEVLKTLEDPEQVEEEIRYLFEALAR